MSKHKISAIDSKNINIDLTEAAQYTVTAYTFDKINAGSDDPVYLSIIGTKGKTSEYLADNPGNDRERGQVDAYTFIDAADIGDFQTSVCVS